jgi:hypothetical protein
MNDRQEEPKEPEEGQNMKEHSPRATELRPQREKYPILSPIEQRIDMALMHVVASRHYFDKDGEFKHCNDYLPDRLPIEQEVEYALVNNTIDPCLLCMVITEAICSAEARHAQWSENSSFTPKPAKPPEDPHTFAVVLQCGCKRRWPRGDKTNGEIIRDRAEARKSKCSSCGMAESEKSNRERAEREAKRAEELRAELEEARAEREAMEKRILEAEQKRRGDIARSNNDELLA